jgi:hypothetical protein
LEALNRGVQVVRVSSGVVLAARTAVSEGRITMDRTTL